MADETWTSIASRHDGFNTGAIALFEASVGADPKIVARAYELLSEFHAAGLDPPTNVSFPSIVWEKRAADRVATATVTIRREWWDVMLFGYDDHGTDKIAGAWAGTARSVATHIKRFFREDHGE